LRGRSHLLNADELEGRSLGWGNGELPGRSLFLKAATEWRSLGWGNGELPGRSLFLEADGLEGRSLFGSADELAERRSLFLTNGVLS
jgi:hypothetical protein